MHKDNNIECELSDVGAHRSCLCMPRPGRAMLASLLRAERLTIVGMCDEAGCQNAGPTAGAERGHSRLPLHFPCHAAVLKPCIFAFPHVTVVSHATKLGGEGEGGKGRNGTSSHCAVDSMSGHSAARTPSRWRRQLGSLETYASEEQTRGTSSHCAVDSLSGHSVSRTPSSSTSAAVPGRLPSPAAFSLRRYLSRGEKEDKAGR